MYHGEGSCLFKRFKCGLKANKDMPSSKTGVKDIKKSCIFLVQNKEWIVQERSQSYHRKVLLKAFTRMVKLWDYSHES